MACDHLIFIVCSFMETFNGLQKVNIIDMESGQ